jgi:hypothetical protein
MIPTPRLHYQQTLLKVFILTIFAIACLLTSRQSLAAPACDPKEERFLVLTTETKDGYRFDMFSPGIMASPIPKDTSNIRFFGEVCSDDPFVLVTHKNQPIHIIRSEPYTASKYRLAEKKDYRENVEVPDNTSIGIYEYTGGGTCCGYIHLFQTKPDFEYLGRIDAWY